MSITKIDGKFVITGKIEDVWITATSESESSAARAEAALSLLICKQKVKEECAVLRAEYDRIDETAKRKLEEIREKMVRANADLAARYGELLSREDAHP